MLADSSKPAKRRNQVSLKFTTCHAGCGAQVSCRTFATVLCEACKPSRRAEQKRRAAAVQRLKRGLPPVKGTAGRCGDCGTEFVRTGARSHRCTACQSAAAAERARQASAAKYATQEGREDAHRYRRERRQVDAAFALNLRIKTYMAKSLRGRKEGRKWQDLVGYTLADLMQHLERQFIPGMSWGNRADWHIDHIVPLSSFKFDTPDDPEFRAAWALTNLRPLWKADNLKKNAQRLFLI